MSHCENSRRPRVRLVVQPTVSHYRAPLIHALRERNGVDFSLTGRYTNTDERSSTNQIASAPSGVLDYVDRLVSYDYRVFRWEKGILKSVYFREYDAFVLEGRVYTISTWLSLLTGKVRGVPIFLWGHGWKRPEKGLKRVFRKLFYRLSNGLLVYGDRARVYSASVGLDVARVAVVGNSIYSTADLKRLGSEGTSSEAKAQHSTFNIVVSARLTSRHKIDLLARSIARMPADDRRTTVTIIGDGTERPGLQAAFLDAGIDATFLGAVYGAEPLSNVYTDADVAVSPRASGLNIVQAMGFGVPVVAPSNDPTSGPESELVEDGQTGLLFELDDVDMLAKHLVNLRQNPDLGRRMGAEARLRILETHTAEAHAQAICGAVVAWLNKSDPCRRQESQRILRDD